MVVTTLTTNGTPLRRATVGACPSTPAVCHLVWAVSDGEEALLVHNARREADAGGGRDGLLRAVRVDPGGTVIDPAGLSVDTDGVVGSISAAWGDHRWNVAYTRNAGDETLQTQVLYTAIDPDGRVTAPNGRAVAGAGAWPIVRVANDHVDVAWIESAAERSQLHWRRVRGDTFDDPEAGDTTTRAWITRVDTLPDGLAVTWLGERLPTGSATRGVWWPRDGAPVARDYGAVNVDDAWWMGEPLVPRTVSDAAGRRMYWIERGADYQHRVMSATRPGDEAPVAALRGMNAQGAPSVGVVGDTALVAWEDPRTQRIVAQRYDREGRAIASTLVEVSPPGQRATAPRVVASAAAWMVFWSHSVPGQFDEVVGTLVRRDGSTLAVPDGCGGPTRCAEPFGSYQDYAAASNGDGWFVAQATGSVSSVLITHAVTPSGGVVRRFVPLANDGEGAEDVAVASNGDGYFAVWNARTWGRPRGLRFARNGASAGALRQELPSVGRGVISFANGRYTVLGAVSDEGATEPRYHVVAYHLEADGRLVERTPYMALARLGQPDRLTAVPFRGGSLWLWNEASPDRVRRLRGAWTDGRTATTALDATWIDDDVASAVSAAPLDDDTLWMAWSQPPRGGQWRPLRNAIARVAWPCGPVARPDAGGVDDASVPVDASDSGDAAPRTDATVDTGAASPPSRDGGGCSVTSPRARRVSLAWIVGLVALVRRRTTRRGHAPPAS